MRGTPLKIRPPEYPPVTQWLCKRAGECLSDYYATQADAWAALVAECKKASDAPQKNGRPDASNQLISSEEE